MEDRFKRYLSKERARSSAEHASVRLISHIGQASITLMLFWNTLPRTPMVIWLMMSITLSTSVFFIQRALAPDKPLYSLKRWEIANVLCSFSTGFFWSLAPALFFVPDNTFFIVVTVALYCGYVSGSLAVNLSFKPSFIVFAIGITAPLMIAQFNQGGAVYNTISGLMVFYISMLIYVSFNMHKLYVISVEAKFENELLVERLALEKAEVEKANIEKSQFMAATSHDLRQPLHAQGLLIGALTAKKIDPHYDLLIEKLSQSNVALEVLFDSLLEISQLDAGTVKVSESHQSLNIICAQIIDEFEQLANEKKLTIHLEGEDTFVFSDPVLLLRIIRNLVSNAIKYTQAGGVVINITSLGNTVSLSVTDTGIGIEKDQHEMIFNEYMQLNNNARDRRNGVGLGLALVRRMCELLGHSISLESTVGEGSTFLLTLPKGSQEKVLSAEKTIQLNAFENYTIAIIDDEKPILEAMTALFETWNCNCFTFLSIKDAEETLAKCKQDVDFIISDYRLKNDETGIQCINRIRKVVGQNIPAILLSGDTDPALLKLIQAEGFHLLHKPLRPSKLRNLMSSLLN